MEINIMGQATPDGTYTGTVDGGGASNAITLRISQSNPSAPSNNMGNSTISYGGTEFNVSGTFNYARVTPTSSVKFRVTASPVSGNEPVYFIELDSPDQNYGVMTGSLTIDRGVGAGNTYSITLHK
jgi:hypothetical protein